MAVGPVSGGTLVETSSSGRRLESSSAGQFTVLVGSLTPDASIQVSPPTFMLGATSDPTGTTRIATATVDGTSITSGTPSDTAALSVGSTTVSVNLQIERPDVFPAGLYQYAVGFTIVPN
ncbi:MAG: hypothetical protein ACFB5Z_05405 [Elainellaceae cyanobacterium]